MISATHQDLLSQINHGEFRHDLFYRLRTFEIKLPPLRHRKDDIPELVAYFLKRLTLMETVSSTPEFIDALMARPWYGNVRELQSVVERAAALARGGVMTADHVSDDGQSQVATPPLGLDDEIRRLVSDWTEQNWDNETAGALYEAMLEVIDPAILPKAFELSDNQYSAAARRLGIHRTTLKKKLDQIGDRGVIAGPSGVRCRVGR